VPCYKALKICVNAEFFRSLFSHQG
jgi:hypothetical protein